jgi:transcription initiation factor IIF auxiliary subunit
MSLSIGQDAAYIGIGRSKFSVWLEGAPVELDEIDYVTYILGATFHEPVRRVHDSETGFRLEASSWGGFTLHAKAVQKDGGEIPMKHKLVLRSREQ